MHKRNSKSNELINNIIKRLFKLLGELFFTVITWFKQPFFITFLITYLKIIINSFNLKVIVISCKYNF